MRGALTTGQREACPTKTKPVSLSPASSCFAQKLGYYFPAARCAMSDDAMSNASTSAPAPTKERAPSRITLRKRQEEIPDENLPTFHVTYGREKSLAQFGKNPLVPIGAFTTAAILLGGLMSFRVGNVQLSQYMMRARVVAQGATLGVLSFSVARMQMAHSNHNDENSSPSLDHSSTASTTPASHH